jgi:hypothetical protein
VLRLQAKLRRDTDPRAGKQRRVQPGEEIERGALLVFSLLNANHRRELREVVLGLAWQRPAFDEMFVVARRTGIVGGEKSGRTVAIEHLAEIGDAGQNIVMGIAGIGAEAMADA